MPSEDCSDKSRDVPSRGEKFTSYKDQDPVGADTKSWHLGPAAALWLWVESDWSCLLSQLLALAAAPDIPSVIESQDFQTSDYGLIIWAESDGGVTPPHYIFKSYHG